MFEPSIWLRSCQGDDGPQSKAVTTRTTFTRPSFDHRDLSKRPRCIPTSRTRRPSRSRPAVFPPSPAEFLGAGFKDSAQAVVLEFSGELERSRFRRFASSSMNVHAQSDSPWPPVPDTIPAARGDRVGWNWMRCSQSRSTSDPAGRIVVVMFPRGDRPSWLTAAVMSRPRRRSTPK